MSEVAVERARLLIEQNRMAMAEQELRRALAEAPNDGQAHTMLALSLQGQNKPAEALAEAREGARLAPDEAYSHYVLAHILCQQDQKAAGLNAINESLRLDPYNSSGFALLAVMLLDTHKPRAALEAADRGLAIDAENVECANVRAMALVRMGRKADAAAAIDGALQREPENALSHANQGWTHLHRNEPTRALEHFAEALRLEPGMEWARQGLLQAMRARYIVYRAMLAYFLWMARLSPGMRVGVIIGLFIAARGARVAAKEYPAAAPYLWALLALYLAFVFLSWASEPIFNLALRLNRFGRLALNRSEIVISNFVGVALLAAIGCAAAFAFVPKGGFLLFIAAGCAMLVMVLGGVAGAATPRSLIVRSVIAGALACTLIAAIALYLFVDEGLALIPVLAFGIGAIVFTWVVSLKSARE